MQVELSADCARCVGLCCVLPAFARSADFALDKPAGVACPNLAADHRCTIHSQLRSEGFAGCTVFDCFGAGQRLVASVGTGSPARLDAAFGALRQVHELLWHLAGVDGCGADVSDLRRRAEALGAEPDPGAVAAVRAEGSALFARVSRSLREGGARLAGADLAGRDLRRTDLRDADLRNALLLGADLRGARLGRADLLGADLRGCDLRGADLSHCLFLCAPQVAAAQGDMSTALPDRVPVPAHWRRTLTPAHGASYRPAGPRVTRPIGSDS